jgi:hypothetical protein
MRNSCTTVRYCTYTSSIHLMLHQPPGKSAARLICGQHHSYDPMLNPNCFNFVILHSSRVHAHTNSIQRTSIPRKVLSRRSSRYSGDHQRHKVREHTQYFSIRCIPSHHAGDQGKRALEISNQVYRICRKNRESLLAAHRTPTPVPPPSRTNSIIKSFSG